MSARNTRRAHRIAVVATPFGFGPASKAYSIGQVLRDEWGMDIQFYGRDSAWDFFAAQPEVRPRRPEELGRPDSADAVVNVLAPELIRSPATAAMTYYVDSLGFMWQPSDIPTDSLLKRVRGYFAQDLFGSAANLVALGVPGVTPVSGIVAPTAPGPALPGKWTGRRVLVQLGGLSNPAGHGSGQVYLALAQRLLTALRDISGELSIAMNHAGGRFSLDVGHPARQLSGGEFHSELADCGAVLSSPGMTTLIEASRARRPYVPLPPQNWSQVVICQHLARRSELGVWEFLTGPYATIDARAPEADKAAQVQEVNRTLGRDDGYAAAYADLARAALAAGVAPDVGAPFEGAREVAAAVAAGLADSPQHAISITRGAGRPRVRSGPAGAADHMGRETVTGTTTGGLVSALRSLTKEVETARNWSEVSRELAQERVATVFGSARVSREEPAYAMARDLGAALAAGGWTTVTGGGPGIMQAARDGSGESLSRAVRVEIPGEEPETFLDPARSITVATFALRKLLLTHDIDALFVFPGGVGTFDELYEVLVHQDTNRLERFPVVLMQPPGGELWSAWLEFMDEHLVRTGLASSWVTGDLVVAGSVDEAVAAVEKRHPAATRSPSADGCGAPSGGGHPATVFRS
ncbi:LOG family protein [Streptomyces axinellae]|uniref:Uncharacterized protein n=1 Tax=Streptomyces axinellae TaxID=552788 RepID=A0ABN3R0Z4_9ACTN